LLAQVDSSVGGKVAVNHPAGKNLIGAFHQPDAVFADLGALQTLPERDYVSGLAEVVKYACLADDGFLEFLLANQQAVLARQPSVLEEIIARCCRYKAEIVALDEREEGPRMFLNLGHTYAHAIEAQGDFSLYTHGEAVAIGLSGALKLSERLAGLEAAAGEKIRSLLKGFGLPIKGAGLKPAKIYEALWHDKKALGGRLRWVLVKAPGAPFVTKEVPAETVMSVLEELML
jgi:3-dehydroquinate synthase